MCTYLLEIRLKVIPALSRIAQTYPVIYVTSTRTFINESSNNSAPTEHPTLRDRPTCAIERCLRDGRDIPIVCAADVLASKERRSYRRFGLVCLTSFNDENIDVRIF